MNNFFSQANSATMYIACGAVILLVMLCCISGERLSILNLFDNVDCAIPSFMAASV